ncbi:hypothethical protein (plasmid) [Ralstonia solanacearum CMR15]|nr:hypothethical protein [Ralstonia solanacearum CMR15]
MSMRELDRCKVIEAVVDDGLMCEKLRERHGIDLSTACVRRIMIGAGFWVPRKLRPPKVYQPRNRRACLGELVQIDGSDHTWYKARHSSKPDR